MKSRWLLLLVHIFQLCQQVLAHNRLRDDTIDLVFEAADMITYVVFLLFNAISGKTALKMQISLLTRANFKAWIELFSLGIFVSGQIASV